MGYLDSFEAAIFDLDGTLIDSMHLWNNFCSESLRSLGITPEDSLESAIQSMTVSQSADYINRNYGLNLSVRELVRLWEEVMITRYLGGAVLKKGAAELLGVFSQKGIKLGIATYSLPRACETILSRFGVHSLFSSFFYAHEFEEISSFVSVKKDPMFWTSAANRLGVAPKKCIVFEDSWSSLEGVRAAGMNIAAVYDASSSRWPLLSKAADIALNYPGEALKYFG